MEQEKTVKEQKWKNYELGTKIKELGTYMRIVQ